MCFLLVLYLRRLFSCFLIDEKLHASTGTMCASKGLRALVDSDEMKRENNKFAQREHEVEQRRKQQLGIEQENNTGVVLSSSPAVLVQPNV